MSKHKPTKSLNQTLINLVVSNQSKQKPISTSVEHEVPQVPQNRKQTSQE